MQFFFKNIFLYEILFVILHRNSIQMQHKHAAKVQIKFEIKK